MTEKKFEPLRVKVEGPRLDELPPLTEGEARTIWKGDGAGDHVRGLRTLYYKKGDRDAERLGRQEEQSGCGVDGV